MMEIAKLIERHIAMQDIQERLHHVAHRPGAFVESDVAYGPCLLISRECGSGGVGIGKHVSQRLGWNLFDREIVDEIARLAHVRERLIESVDEHVRSYWDRTWLEVLTASDLVDKKYLRYLREVVLSLAYHGEAVIIGRGAQYILPSRCAVRVRVVAPLPLRIERVAEREGLSQAQARAKVKEFDAERTLFIKKTFEGNAASPLNYDLLINTAEVSMEHGAEIVLVALREKLGVSLHAPAHASK